MFTRFIFKISLLFSKRSIIYNKKNHSFKIYHLFCTLDCNCNILYCTPTRTAIAFFRLKYRINSNSIIIQKILLFYCCKNKSFPLQNFTLFFFINIFHILRKQHIILNQTCSFALSQITNIKAYTTKQFIKFDFICLVRNFCFVTYI